MVGALHDGLRAREPDVVAEAVRDREVGGADQEEAELRLAQRLVELGIAASRDVEREGVRRLLDDVIFERVVAGIGLERRGDELAEIGFVLGFPNSSPKPR